MKKLLRGIAFLIVLFFVLNRTYEILSWKDTYGDYDSSVQQLYATDDNLADVIFLGSSHCYCSISPDVLWRDYGISAFNMAISGQDKDTTYHALVETLKTQSPQVVCVEVYGLASDKHAILGNEYRNMLALKWSKNQVELIKEYTDEEKQQMDYILKWPVIHTRYKELDQYDFVQNDYSEYGRGAKLSYNVGNSWYPVEAMNTTKKEALSEKNKQWMDKLYALSIEHDFQLIFFSAPAVWDETQQLQIDAANEYAKEQEMIFWDFNHMIGEGSFSVDYQADFLDAGHLNGVGAEKLTSYFGMYFDNYMSLEDHRGEEAYVQWEKSYTYYEQIKQSVALERAATLEEYVEALSQMQNVTYVVGLMEEYKSSTLDIENAIKALGLTKEDYQEGGTYLYADGTLHKVLDRESEEQYIYEINEYDSFKIENLSQKGETSLKNIMLNMQDVGATYNGISFAVYDNVQKELINSRGFY